MLIAPCTLDKNVRSRSKDWKKQKRHSFEQNILFMYTYTESELDRTVGVRYIM